MSRDYVLASSVESMRLERQAGFRGRERPLQHIRLAPLVRQHGACELDVQVQLHMIHGKYGDPIDPPYRTNYEEVPLFLRALERRGEPRFRVTGLTSGRGPG